MDNSLNLQSEISNINATNNIETSFINDVYKKTNSKEQLKKVATEFESIFITKMLTTLDKTVDKENGLFSNEGNYMKNFKSYMFMELGRDIAKNPNTSFGFAKQIYEQMEKFLPKEQNNIIEGA